MYSLLVVYFAFFILINLVLNIVPFISMVKIVVEKVVSSWYLIFATLLLFSLLWA